MSGTQKFPTGRKKLAPRLSGLLGGKEQRAVRMAGASCFINAILALGKFFIGIYSFDFYVCASGFYTLGMVLAKICVLFGFFKIKKTARQYHYYQLSGIILIIASGAYITYSVQLLIHPQSSSYNEIIGITIAAVTFFELGLNIRGVLIERKSKTPLFYMLKMINLSSAIICLALTQAALLSFQETGAQYSLYNGLIGILLGSITIFLGIMAFRKMKHDKALV